MKKIFFYAFLFIFVLTAVVTLLGITQLIVIKEVYLSKLFYSLIIELVGVVILLFTKARFFEYETATTKTDLEKHPVLSHIYRKMDENDDADFAIHSLICPDPQPLATPQLNWMNLYSLWADPRGSEIRVSVTEHTTPPEMQVVFFNGKNTYPSNFTIRPGGLHPLQREKEYNHFCYEARIPSIPKESNLDLISMSFRIIDQLGTHWFRMKGDDLYVNETIKQSDDSNGWQRFSIPLYDDKWRVFRADGNFRYSDTAPRIQDMVLAVVIEVGSDRRDERPGPGSGEIHFRNFCLKQ